MGLLDAMDRARAGSTGPLEAWIRDRYPALVRACARWTGDEALGERLAWRIVGVAYLHRASEGGSELAWMRRVAALQRLAMAREDRRFGQVGGPPPGEPAAPRPSPVDEAVRAESRLAVRTAIAALPVKYRETLYQRYVLGATEREVADWVGSWTGVGREGTRRILREGREMVRAILRGVDARARWPYRFRKSRWSRTPAPPPSAVNQCHADDRD